MLVKNLVTDRIEKHHSFTFRYMGIEYPMGVTSVNGEVRGNAKKGLRTSKLSYFDLPLEERERHFDFIKSEIEQELKKGEI